MKGTDGGVYSAITHGISAHVGSVEVGKLADLVLWKPENFGAKPEMVLKGGVIAWAQVRLRFLCPCASFPVVTDVPALPDN